MAAVTAPGNVAHRLLAALERRGAAPAQRFEVAPGVWEPRSGTALVRAALRVASGLRALGVRRGDPVGLVADGGPRWLEANLGIVALGAMDVPRGSDTAPGELARILAHSGARTCVVIGDGALARVMEARRAGTELPRILRLDGEAEGEGVLGAAAFDAVASPAIDRGDLPEAEATDPASLIYTSGTTGAPKGATLLHGNFRHQLDVLPAAVDFRPGDVFLSMLPPWHVYERIAEYVAAEAGGEVAFSSPRGFGQHLQALRPTWMATVPRIWEAVLALSGYRRLRERDPAAAAATLRVALGGRLRTGVSGGGSLPPWVDDCYAEAGVQLLVGYGLTETAPVLTVRRPGNNRGGTVGPPVEGTEIRLAGRDGSGDPPPGQPGRVLARGPQVMAGYWKEPELTAAVLDSAGWFDTGDLASWTAEGHLVFRGRAKETIVLRGGENVEPSRLEERLAESPLVEWAVVVGQDRKVPGALLVPRREAVDAAARALRGGEGAASPQETEALLRAECHRLLSPEAGFSPHERVGRLAVIEERFTPENGLLTTTQKVRRAAVMERHGDRIREMFGGEA